MTGWRWAVGAGTGLVVGLPLCPALAGLANEAAWTWSPADLRRVVLLTGNTMGLVAGTLILAVPAGIVLALALFRSRVPGRRAFLALLLLLLFVPVPVLVSSWQSLLGQSGPWPLRLWPNSAALDRPWATGWGPAIWVQALAGLPWVVFVVGLGLRWVPAELEEEALQHVSWRRTALLVTLPATRASVAAAVLLVALFTANDIGVTGMMQIATFAEEFDTQFSLGNEEALARIALLTMPLVLPAALLLVLAATRLQRSLPPLAWLGSAGPPLVGRMTGLGLLVPAAALAVVPFAGLLWNLGQAGRPATWSSTHLWAPLVNDARLYGSQIVQSISVAVVTGAAVAGLGLVCCWLAAESIVLRCFLALLLSFAWLLPGPVVGISLKQAILLLAQHLPDGPWLDLLYHGPSPVPVMWAQAIRFLPVAVFFLWPVVRLLPPDLRDAARLAGARPLTELIHVVWPLTSGAVLVTALAIAALCLGEVGASGRVETPSGEPFAKLILDRMHYGIDRNVASLCVLLLGAILVTGAAAYLWFRQLRGLRAAP